MTRCLRPGPAILLTQLIAWLGISFLGYMLLLWPFESGGIASAFTVAGSAMFTSGSRFRPARPRGDRVRRRRYRPGIVALQIAYLPVLYVAFNRRETDVALLNARAGVPSWGPELLARTHYALGSGVSTIDTLPDCMPSGNAGPPTSRRATPLPAAGTVPLTQAAVILGDRAAGGAGFRRAVPDAIPGNRAGGAGPSVPAQRILCFPQIAQAMGIEYPQSPTRSARSP